MKKTNLCLVLLFIISITFLLAEQIVYSNDILIGNGDADRFGWSCDLSGDYAVVGAYGHDDPEWDCGAAYVFYDNAGTWEQVAKLQRTTPEEGDIFGYSVAIDSNVVVVGAPQVDGEHGDEGFAYVFVKPVEGWTDMTPTATLSGTGVDYDEEFGNCVDIEGDYIFVGTHYNDPDLYIYEKPIGGWATMVETWSITHSAPWFGYNFEIAGDYAVIGAYGDNNYAGACYVYENIGAGWIEVAKLSASDATQGIPDPSDGDWLGTIVSMHGTTAAATTSKDNNNRGAVYIWEMPGTGWENMTETAKLTASDASGGITTGDRLGSNLSIYGDYVCAGAYLQHNTNGEDAGAAYIYIKPSGGWVTKTEDLKLLASNGIEEALFGYGVALEGDNLLIGSYGFDTDPPNEPLTGVVYFYDGMLDLESEPSNHVNDFTATPFSASQIDLSWTENDGTQPPDGYLILASTGEITDPTDGTEPSDDTDLTDGEGIMHVAHGSSSYSFSNCSASTTYNFQIYPYTNSGDLINYKTDGTVPSDDTTTLPAEPTNHVLDFSASALDHTQINVSWTENDGAVVPAGYLIKSSTGVIAGPIDGDSPAEDTDLTDGDGLAYVDHGNEIYSFFSVNAGTTYKFKLFPYTGTGSTINYKTVGDVPSDDATTPTVPVDPEEGDLIITEICGDGVDGVSDMDGFMEIYNTSLNNISLDNVIIRYYDDGSASPLEEILFGSLDSHEYFVIGQMNFFFTYGFSPDLETIMFPFDGGDDSIVLIIPDKRATIDRFNDPADPFTWSGEDPLERTSTGDGGDSLSWTENIGGTGTPGEENDMPVPVTLSSFTATFNNEAATISWQTQSETNNQGWNLYRNESNNFETAQKINSNVIEGAGTSFQPTNYEFVDEEIIELDNSEFWYWLESIANDGSTALFGSVNLKIENPDNPDSPQIPIEYGLHKNYPNPFNPTTEISFALSNDSQVELQIFNAKGQKIKTLVKGFFKANNSTNKNYKFIWDGRNNNGNKVTSGVYIYKFVTEYKTEVKKMLLLK